MADYDRCLKALPTYVRGNRLGRWGRDPVPRIGNCRRSGKSCDLNLMQPVRLFHPVRQTGPDLARGGQSGNQDDIRPVALS